MKIEVRADSVNITGYVNVTGKRSKPVVTPHGKCIEVIEERAFAPSRRTQLAVHLFLAAFL